MRDDLTSKLEAALGKEHVPESPDLAWVLARGHRLRVRRLALLAVSAVVVVAAITTAIIALPPDDDARNFVAGDPSAPPHESFSPQVPREGEVVEEMTEQQRAEVFAFRALAATGLMDPFGKRSLNWTYEDDTVQTPRGSWRISFAASDCAPRGGHFTCRGLSGDDPETGNALADTFLVVALNESVWNVVDIEGNILEEERDRVVGYQLPDRVEPSHWEVPAVRHSQQPDEGLSVTMLPLWVGPYPTNAPGSVCNIELRDGESKALGDGGAFYYESPQREFERAGWVSTRGIESPGRVEGVQVDCRQYTGPGWEISSDPEILGAPGMVSGIIAELVWRGDEGFTAPALCRATLVDEAGEVVWEGSSSVLELWRPNELKNYPYRTDVHVTVRGEPVDAQRLGDFSCRSL